MFPVTAYVVTVVDVSLPAALPYRAETIGVILEHMQCVHCTPTVHLNSHLAWFFNEPPCTNNLIFV